MPPETMPSKISDLASAMASQVSKNSRWAGAMVVTMRDMGTDEADQRADLAEMVHPHFEHAVSAIVGHRGKTERHAPVIVVGGGGNLRAAERAQRKAQHFLGRRLAGAAGDGDDLGTASGARRAGEIFQSALRAGDDEKRSIAGRTGRLALHQRAAGLRGKRRATKSWPSRASPFSATKRSPGFSVRVSMESPVASKARVNVPSVAASISSAVHSALMPPGLRAIGRCHRFRAIAERTDFAADDLAGFVTFSGDDETIAGLKLRNRFADG